MSKQSVNISKIKIKEIMKTGDLLKIKMDSAAGDAAKLMLKNRIHGLPVVNPNDEKKVEKVVTAFDLLGLTYYGRFSEDTDYINTTKIQKLIEEQELITMNPEQTLKQALDIIAEKNIRTIPIVDDNNKLLGIVSIIDIVKAILTYGKESSDED